MTDKGTHWFNGQEHDPFVQKSVEDKMTAKRSLLATVLTGRPKASGGASGGEIE